MLPVLLAFFSLTSADVLRTTIFNVTRDPGILIEIGLPKQRIYCNYIDYEHYGMVIVDGYDPSKSETVQNLSVSADGTFSNMKDVIFVAGVALVEYPFQFLNSAGQKFKNRVIHGNCNLFMGRNANVEPRSTILGQMLFQGTVVSPVRELSPYLDAPIISYFLKNFSAPSEMGQMTIGAVDSTHCGKFKWYDSYGGSSWNVHFTGVSVNGRMLNQSGLGEISLTDGSHFVPWSVLAELLRFGNFTYSNLREMYGTPCSQLPQDLPSISFFVEGDPITIDQQDYIEQIYDDCFLNFQTQGSLPFIYSIQYNFQRKYCAAINYKTLQFGIAAVK